MCVLFVHMYAKAHIEYTKEMKRQDYLLGGRKELAALPSMVCTDARNSKAFDAVFCEKEERMFAALGRKLEQRLNGYYVRHPKEWKELAERMQKEKS